MSGAMSGSLTFGGAMDAVRGGRLAARAGWPLGTWVTLVKPTSSDPVNTPYLVLDKPSPPQDYPGGVRQPYVPPHDDMLADDWQVIE